jgi:hypothetical protein
MYIGMIVRRLEFGNMIWEGGERGEEKTVAKTTTLSISIISCAFL